MFGFTRRGAIGNQLFNTIYLVYKRTAASPKPRPAASITPVIILGRQAGSNMWNIACQRVEPSPIPASKYPLGSPFMAVLLYTTGSGTNIRWGNWNLASSTCPLNPFRSAETLSLQIWDLQVNGQNQDLANLASAVLLILVLAFSIGANVLSNKINKKNSGEKA